MLRHATRSTYSEYVSLEFARLQHDNLHPKSEVFYCVMFVKIKKLNRTF
jgi:hypothetical protein